mgnify:CR=1 FL=1
MEVEAAKLLGAGIAVLGVIGSGIGTSIAELLNITFSQFDLNYMDFTHVDSSLLRKGDPERIISDPLKLKNEL